jgi:predicted O-methyltransferase YrrM
MALTLADYYNAGDFIHITSTGWFGCDKGTCHNYIRSYYDGEFTPRRDEKLNILEIGVQYGGSTYLWSNYFSNAMVYGIDIEPQLLPQYASIQEHERVKLIWGDAYEDSIVSGFPNQYFDYIIDDGPHTVSTQLNAIDKWLVKIKSGGKLIIEDIQSEEDLNTLLRSAWQNRLTKTVCIFDTRVSHGRYDDVIIEITRK